MHNSQKEALQKCVRRLEECVPYLPIGLRTFVFETIREAQAALSTPPRNCERFANEDEASKAFIDWYNTKYDLKGAFWNEVSMCDLLLNIDDILHAYIHWLFTKAKGADDAR